MEEGADDTVNSERNHLRHVPQLRGHLTQQAAGSEQLLAGPL